MSYINFKEENTVTYEQLEKRKKNNEKIYINILKHKCECLIDYTPSKKYSYKTFIGDEIGKNGKLNEEDFYEINNEDIICTKFKNCSFKNLKFKNCRFIGCLLYTSDAADDSTNV